MAKRKLKPLMPSLREKKRYLAFEVISDGKVHADAVENSVFSAVKDLTGSLGMARAGLLFLRDKWNEEKQRGLIRVSHKSVDELRSSLAFIKDIENKEVIVRSIGLSGVLRKAALYLTH